MKGPGLRLDLDVRRVWRCAKCGRIVRTTGQVTAQRCGCTEPPQWMHLEPAVKKEPFKAPVREHLPEPWEVEASAEAKSTMSAGTEATGNSEQPTAASAAQAPDEPEPASQPTVVTEIITVEIVEIVAAAPVLDPAVPAADEFGTGIDDSTQNPDKT